MSFPNLTQTLVESFNALADEVQNLTDRQTILEHKLRFAHAQFQYLADKYAPAAPQIAETLVNLQLPPEIHSPSLENTQNVPLPRRKPSESDSKHQIALIIREGRRVASALTDSSKAGSDSNNLFSPTDMTSVSTTLEQDFTVEGKKSKLCCPFSQTIPEDEPEIAGAKGEAPPDVADPMCAAMIEESASQAAGSQSGVVKCPIRYMDHHSPEEIAQYLETHKHELPRSHEVCVRRYQRNEQDIRKLDAKYGNLVNMVEGLSKIHQPMLPEQDTRPQSDVEKASNDRVENWAQTVSASASDDPNRTALDVADDDDRQSHFDRPLKEVRVGESPSRPWGISVPIYDTPSIHGDVDERPASPPPAPVQMPMSPRTPATPAKKTGKCPFDHGKLAPGGLTAPHPLPNQEDMNTPRVAAGPSPSQPFTPAPQPSQAPPVITTPAQPAFLNPGDMAQMKQPGVPQMLFTGPVFIGYPMEQAIQFMQQFRGQQ